MEEHKQIIAIEPKSKKKKRQASEKQLQSLAKARAVRKANILLRDAEKNKVRNDKKKPKAKVCKNDKEEPQAVTVGDRYECSGDLVEPTAKVINKEGKTKEVVGHTVTSDMLGFQTRLDTILSRLEQFADSSSLRGKETALVKEPLTVQQEEVGQIHHEKIQEHHEESPQAQSYTFNSAKTTRKIRFGDDSFNF
jgi:hypothetical protein